MADTEGVDLPDDLERLLRQELSVEPSVAFEARVRQRVADQPRRSPWMPWTFAAGCAGAAALALAIVLSFREVPAVPPVAAPANVASVPLPKPPSLPPSPVSAQPAAASRVRKAVSPGPHAASLDDDMPVMIDRRQRAALTTLFRMMELGRVSSESFAATVPVSLEPIAEQVHAITVEPVVVSAIPSGGVLHHDSER